MDSSDDEGDQRVETTPRRPAASDDHHRSSNDNNNEGNSTPERVDRNLDMEMETTPDRGGQQDDDAAVPATPFNKNGSDNINDNEDVVPATPAAGISGTPGTPLTPLSALEDNDEEDDDAEEQAGNNTTRNNANANRAAGSGGGGGGGGDDDDDDDSLLSSDDEDAAAVPPPPPPQNNDDQNEEDDEDDTPLFGQQDQHDIAHVRGTNIHVPTAAAAFTDFLRKFRSLAHARRAATNGNAQEDEDSDSDDDDDDSLDSDNRNRRNEQPLYMKKLNTLLTRGAVQVDGNENSTSSPTASLDIDTMHLYYHSQACQRFYFQLEKYPMELVPLMDLVVQRELERMATALAMESDMDEAPHIPSVQVRPYNLRKVSNIRCLDPVDLDALLSIKGMIVRISPVIPDLKVAHFSCTICGHDEQVTIDRGRIAEPTNRCPSCSTSNTFQLIHNRSTYNDKQLVRLQETPDEVPAGQTPASVTTFCYDDLVDCVKPGDKVEVTGVLRAQPARVNPKISKVKSIYKTYVDVIHFKRITGMESSRNRDDERMGREEGAGMTSRFTPDRVRELKALSQEPDIYEKLTQSLAPSIWELDNVKKGVLCMLFGGNHVRVKKGTAARHHEREENEDNNDDENDSDDEHNGHRNSEEDEEKLHKRGDINILLCGDPGTSKSQLLSYVNKLSARGVYTSGKGSSAVGLTASVVRDPETRDLVLESGALVLSDQGICCIDEFDKMSEGSRSVLHEAMEQQTVSIAKAGIIASLNSRTSILASANPTESRYNPSLSVVENIKLPPTLLSRFDLIYLILDSPNVENDRRLAQHLVGLYYETPNVTKPPMDQELLRDYIEYAREHIHPELSDEASEQLIASYLEMRNPMGSNVASNGSRTISATPRQLESLIRLSEALAKMRYSRLVTRGDAREAVRLMKVATQAAATDPRTGRIDMDMLNTGRSTNDREMEEQLSMGIKELLSERRGARMAVRDVTKQLSEITNTTVRHDDVVDALRRMEADGYIQFNERAQTLFVRAGIIQ